MSLTRSKCKYQTRY